MMIEYGMNDGDKSPEEKAYDFVHICFAIFLTEKDFTMSNIDKGIKIERNDKSKIALIERSLEVIEPYGWWDEKKSTLYFKEYVRDIVKIYLL